MRRRSLYGSITAMTIAGALTLSAQTPSTPQTTPRTDDQRSGSEQTVTVTGCLQQNSGTGMSGAGSAGSTGSATSGGTGSTAGSTTSTGASGSSQGRSSNFVLANAKIAPGSSTSGLGTTTRFSLTGMSDAELSKHLNHQVEVTGRLSAAMSGTTGTTGASGTTTGTTGSTGSTGSTGGTGSTGSTAGTTARSGGTTGSGAGMIDVPQLHATNLKMISATCPAQQ